MSLYEPFPETAWLTGFTTVTPTPTARSRSTDLKSTPRASTPEAARVRRLTLASAATITINPGALLSDVVVGDPDWQNHIDGVDVLFTKTGSGTSTKYTLKATNPGTFKYRLSLTNETGTEIHVKGRKLPNIIKNGVSSRTATARRSTVFLTVPSMPSSVGTRSTPAAAADAGRRSS